MTDRMGAETFPIGYHRFHPKQIFNFQLNRWYSLGFARYEDFEQVGKKIRSFDDWRREMLLLAQTAEAEGRYANAAAGYRGAEFYTFEGDSPDKIFLYDKFRENFRRAFPRSEQERSRIPYGNTFLPAIRLAPSNRPKGTILLHGGFDSFLEEWYPVMRYLAGHGYEVIGFEGPGQGAALLKEGIPMDIEWEKPVGAVLDFFDRSNVTIFGLSMGGWFCLRAAAFDSRIKRAAASGNALDYMEIPPAWAARTLEFSMKYENFFNACSFRKMKRNPALRWQICNTMHITKKKSPLDAMRFSFSLSRENMHPERIQQDVLLLPGRRDHFIPFKMHRLQVEALVNAASITERVFTGEDRAQNHCQVGNIGLLLDTFLEWLEDLNKYCE